MNGRIPEHGDKTGQFRGIPAVEVGLVSLEVLQGRFCVVVPLESGSAR